MCSTRSACATSSSVDWKAATSWCGRSFTKPTVSETVMSRPSGVRVRRTVGSSVANSCVLHQHAGAGDAVEQRGLARVGVADDRHVGHGKAVLAAHVAGGLHVLDGAAQLGHAGADAAAVQLDLGLTGPARSHARGGATHLATGLAGHGFTPAAQSRQQVFELRQLHLRLALFGLGVLGEDVQDQRGAVDDLDLDHVLQRATLAGLEFVVDDHGVGAHGLDDVAQLDGLALADVRGGVGVGAALQHAVEHLGARGFGQGGEFAQRHLGLGGRAAHPLAHEHHLLEAQLPVLDLGDVLELGGHADAAQALAELAFHLVAVVVGAPGFARAHGRSGARQHPVDHRFDRGV